MSEQEKYGFIYIWRDRKHNRYPGANLGKKFSPEHKAKIAAAHKKRWAAMSDEKRKSIGQNISKGRLGL